MSLKFGIYLVEQRIISPEQFCGLVKIQQEATMSLATISIRKNILTIKQVARVLDTIESNPGQTFIRTAAQLALIDANDAERMLLEQQLSCPSIQKLLVECGLLTERQCNVLYDHHQKLAKQLVDAASAGTQGQVATETEPATHAKVGPRQPKFTQRPATAQPSSAPVQ